MNGKSRESRAERTGWWIVFALAFAAGIFLRCWQLGSQILLDDEWHAIQKLLYSSYADIATHFGANDYCIPLTLYFRFLFDHGGLSDWGMRWPMLASGIALIGIAPWLLRSYAGTPTLALCSGLLAISPLMVYHSRTARPYAITTLLVFFAIVAFFLWWRSRERRWAAVYVFATFLAGWLHLITLPFTLLPFAYFGCAVLWRGRAGIGDFMRLLLLGIVAALALAVVLLPPLLTDMASLAGKSGHGVISVASIYQSLLLALGISAPWLLAVMLALALLGAWSLWRRDAGFAGYLLVVITGAAAAVLVARPAWVQHPGVLARYLQPSLPFILLFVAEGGACLLRLLPSSARAPIGLTAIVALFMAGPIPGYAYFPNQFMGHPYFQYAYAPADNPFRTTLPAGPIPDFYRRLAALPPASLTLIEAPWSIRSDQDPQVLYQAVHRQRILIGMVAPECGAPTYGQYADNPGMRLRNFVHLSTLSSGTMAGADFLVVHLRPWLRPLPAAFWPDMADCLPQIEARMGKPVYKDADIEVFALSATAHSIASTWR
ncbi:MAG: hypothetical protein JSS13_02610 [Proteobacteria bacterium]|nr:hypothetical protein [Pseudomonadota bacterium]